MFIPLGTIVKDVEDMKKYCAKNSTVTLTWLNDEPEFDVSEYYLGFSAIQSRDYIVKCEKVEGGFKVLRVWKKHKF
jgi:hypothetical protein